jgi:hypothetical protein
MEQRVSRLEEDMHEVKAGHGQLETMVSDVRLVVTRIEAALVATLPHLATKAEVTEILKTLPHLATEAEVAEVKMEMAAMVKTLPYLATKAELAEKPGKGYLVGMIGILLAAHAGGLAALAVLK